VRGNPSASDRTSAIVTTPTALHVAPQPNRCRAAEGTL
jgi:hypothetical protein